jgi:predicted metal-dependent phosphoesterase TrpH
MHLYREILSSLRLPNRLPRYFWIWRISTELSLAESFIIMCSYVLYEYFTRFFLLVDIRMIKVEFHCHTQYSKDSLVKIEDLLIACRRKRIDRLVVTDHNTIEGALKARELDPDRFIIGEEIMTKEGELLAFFVNKEVPAKLSAQKTLDLLHAQGAFISVSHPFDSLRKGHWLPEDLINILDGIDAIEVFNSRCMMPEANTQAASFALRHNLLGTVGSDSHILMEVGRSTLVLPDFEDPASLRSSILQAEYHTRLSPPWVHFFSRYASWRIRYSQRKK